MIVRRQKSRANKDRVDLDERKLFLLTAFRAPVSGAYFVD